MKTLRELISTEAAEHLHTAVDQMLDSHAGFIIIADLDHHKITDSYMGVCDTCVAHIGTHIVGDATAIGSLPEEGVAKLHGHKHLIEPHDHNQVFKQEH